LQALHLTFSNLHASGVDDTSQILHAFGADDTLLPFALATLCSCCGSLLTTTSGSFFVSAEALNGIHHRLSSRQRKLT
jgi:hypothetical protein